MTHCEGFNSTEGLSVRNSNQNGKLNSFFFRMNGRKNTENTGISVLKKLSVLPVSVLPVRPP